MERGGCVYIMTNKNKTTLYVGVTSDLYSRVYEHKTRKDTKSFTAKYNLFHLIWFKTFHSIEEAIDYEKYLKCKNRSFKESLITKFNPNWIDLWNDDL